MSQNWITSGSFSSHCKRSKTWSRIIADILWAGPSVIMPDNGSNILDLDIVTDLLFRTAIWDVFMMAQLKNLCMCTHSVFDLQCVWIRVCQQRDSQTGSVKMECFFYVKLNKISSWASLLPFLLSVLCLVPLPNKAVSPWCINGHQRPQSNCFATGESQTGEAKV